MNDAENTPSTEIAVLIHEGHKFGELIHGTRTAEGLDAVGSTAAELLASLILILED